MPLCKHSSSKSSHIRWVVFLILATLLAQSSLQEAHAAPVSFTPFYDNIGDQGNTETRLVFTTERSYARYFGHKSPAVVYWPREWVAFYSAGIKPTGGYSASITGIQTTASGKTVRTTTHLESPHPQCATQAFTKPYVLVKFRKPVPTPTLTAWSHNESFASCAPAACADVVCPGGFSCVVVQEACLVPPCPYTGNCVPTPGPCSEIRCAPEDMCVVDDGIAHCIDALTCSQISCIIGTHCTIDADGAALCYPDS